ncbi:MAG TPA: multicopper oxidase domain-containing protein [Actinomycetota bacterium]
MNARDRLAWLRPLLLAGLVAAAAFIPAQRALTRGDLPTTCVEPNRHMTMYAVELPREDGKPRLAYGLTPDTASIPGPTIKMIEGDCLAITVVNTVSRDVLRELRDDPLLGSRDPDMPLGVSLHVHGVKYTQSSDGTFATNSWIPPDESRTYVWFAAPKIVAAGRVISQGTAGYWWYHDHVVGTDHGTGGAASGLFGAVIVRRAGDVTPDRTYVVAMGPDATLNLKRFPETDCPAEPSLEDASNSCYVAVQGERVEFAVIGFGDDFHTFHLHGHNWADTRTGMLASQLDDSRLVDNKTVGPADTFGFQIVAGEEVGPGSWMLHCHVQAHSDRGMVTFFHVFTPAGILLNSSAPVELHEHFGRP